MKSIGTPSHDDYRILIFYMKCWYIRCQNVYNRYVIMTSCQANLNVDTFDIKMYIIFMLYDDALSGGFIYQCHLYTLNFECIWIFSRVFMDFQTPQYLPLEAPQSAGTSFILSRMWKEYIEQTKKEASVSWLPLVPLILHLLFLPQWEYTKCRL